MVTNEFGYKILKLLETAPSMSQRELAQEIGISLGKAPEGVRSLGRIFFSQDDSMAKKALKGVLC